jgi:glucose-6-phosphate isomerase
MAQPQIKLHYKNVLAKVEPLGPEHGITDDQLSDLVEKTCPLIKMLNEQTRAGRPPGTAYRKLPYDTQTPQQVKELVAKLKDGCENLVVLGIGGSALGNIALQTALNPYLYNLDDKQRSGPRLFVFDNVDPPQLISFLHSISDDLDKTVFNVISKSGRTAETAAQFLIISDLLKNKLGKNALKNHIVATADPKEGTLRKIATKEQLPSIEIPKGVGGRFSVLSPVGLFSAAMCGIDIDSLLAGARDMDTRVSCEDFYKNPAAVNAAINYHFYNRGKKISVIMPYSYHLKDLADWYRQLWAESLGKAKNLAGNEVHIGPTPVKALGATDQHSQIQLYREGPNDKLFTFLEVQNFEQDLKIGPAPQSAPELQFLAEKHLSLLFNNEKKATEYALLQSHRPCLTVLLPEVSPYTVGQFIYLFEVTTSLTAALLNVNAYDQPAVELGKEASFALMGKTGDYKPNYKYEDFAKDIRTLTKVDDEFLV